MEDFYQTLHTLFAEQRDEEIEPYMVKELRAADDQKEYERYAAIANEMVGFYQLTGQYDKAADAGQDLLLLLEELNMEDSEYYALVMLNHANGFRDSGHLAEAKEYYTRTEKSLLDHDGGVLSMAALYSNLAMYYLCTTDYPEAKATFLEANKRLEAAGALQDPHYVSNTAGIGEASFRMGDTKDALAYYEKALSLIKEQDGEGESYALLCGNCASICEAMKDDEKAAYYKEKQASIHDRMEQES